jgi:ABC-2 type transport system permease protein
MLAVPVLITGAAFWGIGMANGINLWRTMCGLVLQAYVEILLFYHLSCLVVMLAGNGLMVSLVYLVLNVLVLGVSTMYEMLASNFVYGSRSSELNVLDVGRGIKLMTPVLFFWSHTGSGHHYVNQFHTLEYFKKDCIYLIPAAIFLGLAVYLYRKRPLECAGDMVAFSWGKPVFRIVFSFCGGMFFATGIYYLAFYSNMGPYDYSAIFKVILILVGVGAVLFYLIANMALYKTLHIWKKTSYLRMVLLALCMMAGVAVTRNYGLGAALPEKSGITKVDIEYGGDWVKSWSYSTCNNLSLTQQEDIEDMYRLNQQILSYGRNMNLSAQSPDMTYVRFVYTLKNGKTWKNSYPIQRTSDMTQKVKKLLNGQQDLEKKLFGEDCEKNVPEDIDIFWLKGETIQTIEKWNQGKDVTKEETFREELYRAVLEDLSQGRFDLSYTPETLQQKMIQCHFYTTMDKEGAVTREVALYVTEKCLETKKILKKYDYPV